MASSLDDFVVDDDVLVGMFAELAESVAVPSGGAEAALEAVRSGRTEAAPVLSFYDARARRNKRFASVVGVAAAVLIVVGVVAAHGGSPSSSSSSGAVAATAASAPGAQSIERGAVTDQGAVTATGDAASAPAPAAVREAPEAAGLSAAAGKATASGSVASGTATGATTSTTGTTATSGSASGTGSSAVPNVDSDRVIRTGDVNLQVAKGAVPATVPRLEGAATGLGGFLEDSQTQQADPKSGGVPSASVTLRVPAAKFETLLARVQALGTVITSTTSGKDVTDQYVDLDARLKALMTSRETYLVILSKATTVNDTLAVQQRLDDIQQQIEQLQGQENELAAQSDLGTLTVEVSEPAPAPAPTPKPAKPHVRSGLSAAFHTAGDRFRRGTEAVIASLGTIALLAIAGLVLFVGYRVGRRYYLRRAV